MLLYFLKEDTEDVLQSVRATERDRATDDKLMAKLDDFSIRRNVIYKCTKFNRRIQQLGEYSLAETCDFGTIKNQLIHDRLVETAPYQENYNLIQT